MLPSLSLEISKLETPEEPEEVDKNKIHGDADYPKLHEIHAIMEASAGEAHAASSDMRTGLAVQTNPHSRRLYEESLLSTFREMLEGVNRKAGEKENQEEKERMRLKFVEQVLATQELTRREPNLLLHIIAERMKKALELGIIPQDRPMNIAGFIRSGLYDKIRAAARNKKREEAEKYQIYNEPAYYRFIEEIVEKLFAPGMPVEENPAGRTGSKVRGQKENPKHEAIFQAIRAISEENHGRNLSMPAENGEVSVSTIFENEEIRVVHVDRIEHFRMLFPSGNRMVGARDLVDERWKHYSLYEEEWFEAGLDPKRAYGPYLLTIRKAKKEGEKEELIASAQFLGEKELEKWLSSQEFFGGLEIKENALEETILMMKQDGIDTAPLEALREKQKIILKEFNEAKRKCRKESADGETHSVKGNEVVQLTLKQRAGLKTAIDAVKYCVLTSISRKGNSLDAQVEAFPICIVLEIVKTIYNARRGARSEPSVQCYVRVCEIDINDGTEHPPLTYALTTSPKQLDAAWKEADPRIIEKVLANVLRGLGDFATRSLEETSEEIRKMTLDMLEGKKEKTSPVTV